MRQVLQQMKKLDALDEINTKLDNLMLEVSEMKTTQAELKRENNILKETIVDLTKNCDYLEGQSKRQNLLFFGIEESNGKETWEDCESKVADIINTNLNLDIDCNMEIERAHRIGKKSKGKNAPLW